MTALYFDVLKPQDRVAVKPHASPIFHAIQYLFGNQSRDKLKQFRALDGAQSYPSRTKDSDDVDISTGSVGLGVGLTLFSSMVRDYVQFHKLAKPGDKPGRMIAIMGDAELDEGNVFEALLEGWKHDVRDLWWMIDYNRQSLDRVVSDKLFQKIKDFFQAVGWRVVIIKHGKLQQAAFKRPGGKALQKWIDDCPNELYCALTFKGGAAWRKRLLLDIGNVPGMRELLDAHGDDALQNLMTNLAGHDMESVLEALHAVNSDVPHCFIVYTIKGYGLPFAGHKDNHAGLMNKEQMADFQNAMHIREGDEWEPFAGIDIDDQSLRNFIANVPFTQGSGSRRPDSSQIVLPTKFNHRASGIISTQEAFGRILNDLGRGASELADRIVTTSPDVTVSTNLGGWVNQRGIFNRADREDIFHSEKVVSMQKWAMSRNGQHIELGIAENNLFLQYGSSGGNGVQVLTIGGNATSDFAIDVVNGSNNINKVRAAAFVTYSDESLKQDVASMSSTALDTVMSLEGVEFTWKDSGERDFGFIAQDVHSVLPKAVHTAENGVQGVDYSRLTSVLVEAVKTQQVQIDELKILVKYTIKRHYPEIEESENQALGLLVKLIEKQCDLVVNWMRVGFIHGVMNTDNMTVSGETIDYGPCAFMDVYDPKTVFSSIDRMGRYAYCNQPAVTKWNLARFAECLIPLIDKNNDKAIEIATQKINSFEKLYEEKWLKMMRNKLGIFEPDENDKILILDLLTWMHQNKVDYTNTFCHLMNLNSINEDIYLDHDFLNWKKKKSTSNPFILLHNL